MINNNNLKKVVSLSNSSQRDKWLFQDGLDKTFIYITFTDSEIVSFTIPNYNGGVKIDNLTQIENKFYGNYTLIDLEIKGKVVFELKDDGGTLIGIPDGFQNNEIWKLIKQID